MKNKLPEAAEAAGKAAKELREALIKNNIPSPEEWYMENFSDMGGFENARAVSNSREVHSLFSIMQSYAAHVAALVHRNTRPQKEEA